MKRSDHPPVVIVEWHDSKTLTAGWKDRHAVLDEADKDYAEPVMAAGFLLSTNKRYIVLAVGLAPNDDVMHALQIPRSEIVWMRTLRKARGYKLVDAKKDRAA